MILKPCLVLILICCSVLIYSQCTPPPSETCEETIPFCSLNQLNGYTCTTNSFIQSECETGCAGGSSNNRTWIAFISTGGSVTITLSVGNCPIANFPGFGICPGFWGDCHCNEKILCQPGYIQENNSMSYSMNLQACKIYYITLDHGDDQCDFTINTSGGNPPNLILGPINNKASGIIEPVCEGYCDYAFFVDHGGCEAAHFEWTLDGTPVGTNKPELKLDFPQAGDFRLCVSATVGNPHNGAICLEQGPVCTTVKVRRHADRNGTLRTLCAETAAAGTYRWHSQLIQTSGIYRETFTDALCCPYDSVVEFRVLPKPEPPDVYYITCNNVPYVDAMGRRWSPCRTQELIDFPKFTEPYKCDSSIRLTAVNVDIGTDWKAACMNGKVELNPNIKIVKPCEAGESYEYEYNWYRKTDTLKKTLSTDERLLVDSIQFQYCVDVQVKVRLGTAIAVCNKTFCDTINKIKALGSKDSIRLRYCDSVILNNITYTQSDTFSRLWTNVFGCDSLVFTDLKISKSSSSTVQKMECDSVSINGQSYYQSGTYIQTLQNKDQCDSVITLELIVEKSSQTTIRLNQCDSVLYNGQTYYQSGNYLQQFFTSLGCDSILNLEINIAKSSKTDVLLSGCDSIMVNGNNYTQSAIFSQQLKNQLGCDSIIKTELLIHKSSSTDLTLRSCDSIRVNSQLYTITGDYSQLLTSANGCDSVLNLRLDIPKSSSVRLVNSACDSTRFNGVVYTSTGSYNQIRSNTAGCDSILILDLSIHKSYSDSVYLTDCDSVVYLGQTYKTSGQYPIKHQSTNGCDSTKNVFINIPNSKATVYKHATCDSATINGMTYTQSGIYTQTLSSANGCDSTLQIDLNIFTKTAGQITWTACDSAQINGVSYQQSGNYMQLLKNTNLCDSTLDITLNLSKSTSEALKLKSCDSVYVNGQLYAQNGIYTQVLKNAVQCDSILTIDYTRLQNSSSDLSYKSCDSIEVNGQVYKQAGNYVQTLINTNGCDSIINVQIEITKSSSKQLRIQQCDSVEVNGQFYTQSGSYIQVIQNTAQCDSVLQLEIEILKPTTSNLQQTSCDSAVVNKRLYTTTGVYNQLLTNVSGCDSMLTIDLKINKSTSGTLRQTQCDSAIINGQLYRSTGVYQQILTNVSGCDSTLNIDLTIKPGNPSDLNAGVDTTICEGQILKLNGMFTGNANFQWQSAQGSFDYPDKISSNYYPTTSGNHTLYLQAADDCRQWLDSMEVLVLVRQIITVTGDTIIDPCKEITFKASGAANYIWTPASQIECLDPPCSLVKLKSNGITQFTISADGLCVEPAELHLSISQIREDIYLPNVFSPNGDNINDLFLPTVNCEKLTSYLLLIFDRWGNQLFESTDKHKGWDGRSQNQWVMPGVYPYVLHYEIAGEGKKRKKGEVTLVR